jgi:hypothetical protein
MGKNNPLKQRIRGFLSRTPDSVASAFLPLAARRSTLTSSIKDINDASSHAVSIERSNKGHTATPDPDRALDSAVAIISN